VVAIAVRLTLVALLTVGACAAAAAASFLVAPDTGGTLSEAAARNWSPVYRLRDRAGSVEQLDPEGLEVVFRKDTRYHRLLVVDDTNTRYLRFGSSYQSAMDLSNPFSTVFGYTDFFALGLAYKPRARSILFVGLGGGSAPKRMWRDFPWLRVHAVELDPVVADVAHRYFAVPRDPRLGITVEDGRRYLANHDRRWDLIAIDTFFEDGIPFHLTTLESVQLVRERLTPGGVVLVNVIGSIRGEGSKLFRSIYRTYRSVFPTVLVHLVEGGPGEYQNLILVATDQPAATKGFLLDRWRQLRQRHPSAPDLREAIRMRYDGPIPIDGVPTLTDDYAPTDALLTG
jgi:spermidine synthase